METLRAWLREAGEGWCDASPAQRPLYFAALLMGFSFVLHVSVWLLLGGSLEGPVSWRKPILFSLSTGLLFVSLGWVLGLLRPARWIVITAWLFAFALVAEVGLVAMQQWRGKRSHFNSETSFDALVFGAMGALIGYVTAAIFAWTVAAFFRMRASPARAWAAREGLVVLNVACLLGIQLAFHGQAIAHQGFPVEPSVYPPAGNLKFPHGVALHAIQVLPLLAWWVERREPIEARRLARVHAAFAGYCLLIAFALVDTFSGRPPNDPPARAVLLAAMGAVLIGGAFFWPSAPAPGLRSSAAPSGR